jgi:uncharacterized flavoprotein (TIGR03862 family)
MTGDMLSENSQRVAFFESKPGPAWKLLVAGSSGLNVAFDFADLDFTAEYSSRQEELRRVFSVFPPLAWIEHLKGLGEEPYLGTSGRYFLRSWKATSLLQAWRLRLESRAASFHFKQELIDFNLVNDRVECRFSSGEVVEAKTVVLALGGASWENTIPGWRELLLRKGLAVPDFQAANVGYELHAPSEFFAEAEGKAIKGLILRTNKGERQGELMITKYGLEGTPIYTNGASGPAFLDLKPDLSEARLMDRISSWKGPILRRVEKSAKLSPGAFLLFKYLAHATALETPKSAAEALKNFPITLGSPRPLSEAISSSGGLSWDELGPNMEIKKFPRIFAAGEMIDWDAPTGGFLIQAAVSTGYCAAKGALSILDPT